MKSYLRYLDTSYFVSLRLQYISICNDFPSRFNLKRVDRPQIRSFFKNRYWKNWLDARIEVQKNFLGSLLTVH
jgi:hypothetical protein